MLLFIKFLRLVLPITTVATATVFTASLIASKKIDPDSKVNTNKRKLTDFVTLDENFKEKIVTHSESGTKEEVDAEDVEKAEKAIESLKNDENKDDLPFKSQEEAIKFLNDFPQKTLSELLKKSKLSENELSKFESNASIQSGKLGAALKEQYPKFKKSQTGSPQDLGSQKANSKPLNSNPSESELSKPMSEINERASNISDNTGGLKSLEQPEEISNDVGNIEAGDQLRVDKPSIGSENVESSDSDISERPNESVRNSLETKENPPKSLNDVHVDGDNSLQDEEEARGDDMEQEVQELYEDNKLKEPLLQEETGVSLPKDLESNTSSQQNLESSLKEERTIDSQEHLPQNAKDASLNSSKGKEFGEEALNGLGGLSVAQLKQLAEKLSLTGEQLGNLIIKYQE